jgi:hypothetical protein
MQEDQILDSALKEFSVSKGTLRWQWHFKHAVMVIGLYIFIVLCLECVIPYLPQILGDLLGFGVRFLVIFGTCFITCYVCRVGYKWSWLLTLVGGISLFLVCFIVIMNDIKYWINAFSIRLQAWSPFPEDQLEDMLEVFVVGAVYSFYIVIIIEILILLGGLFSTLYRLVKKE